MSDEKKSVDGAIATVRASYEAGSRLAGDGFGVGHIGRARDWVKDTEAIPSSTSTLEPATATTDEQSEAERHAWTQWAKENRGTS